MKTDSGHPRDAGVFFSFTMATPGNSIRFDTHWLTPPVSALAVTLARSGGPLGRCPKNQSQKNPAKKWGDTEIAEQGRSVLVVRARYRSAGLTPHQRGWTDAG